MKVKTTLGQKSLQRVCFIQHRTISLKSHLMTRKGHKLILGFLSECQRQFRGIKQGNLWFLKSYFLSIQGKENAADESSVHTKGTDYCLLSALTIGQNLCFVQPQPLLISYWLTQLSGRTTGKTAGVGFWPRRPVCDRRAVRPPLHWALSQAMPRALLWGSNDRTCRKHSVTWACILTGKGWAYP